jgi:DNA-binding NtrC family response regulator
VAQLRLVFSGDHGVLASPRVVLDGLPLLLGRANRTPALASLAADPGVSREHATVTPRVDGATITDQGSRNGTTVNGAPVTEAPLRDGDVIRVGSSLLVYHFEPVDSVDGALPGFEGRGRAVRLAREVLAAAAPSTATILLLGESGTGKSVAAEAVHGLSGRGGPFVAVNCATIPDGLAESALFGHVAGAFTDAKRDQPGFLRAADRGTLFLDEVGDLSPAVQAKLLTALDGRAAVPLGGVRPIASDVRFIAATNHDLARRLAERSFRGDLHARLSEVVVRLPALREHREDILPLFQQQLEAGSPPLDAALAEELLLHPWAFNVRELAKAAAAFAVLGRMRPGLAQTLLRERLRQTIDASAAAGEAGAATPAEPQR